MFIKDDQGWEEKEKARVKKEKREILCTIDDSFGIFRLVEKKASVL